MDLKRILTVTTLVCLVVVLVGCNSASKSSSSTTTPKKAVCADRAKLESSVRALDSSDTIAGGKTSIDAALKKVKKNLDALRASAKTDLKPKVDDVKSALDQLQAAVGDINAGNISETLRKSGQAVSKVGSSTAALVTALDTECS